MIPHISPGKTWEGFAGALVFSTGGSFALWWLLGPKLSLLRPLDALVLGLGLSLGAVVGDLAESILKRSLDLKDSGRLLPGIGGSLDLIDSVLFTAPLLYYYLRLSELLR
jgi:phosphatidate cytidylyltransferase